MDLHIIPSTGTLTALTFNGALSGTASVATTVALVATDSTDATHFPYLLTLQQETRIPRTDTGFTYNPKQWYINKHNIQVLQRCPIR